MKKLVVITILLYSVAAWSQSTIVTGQVTDPDAQSWNNGSYTINFVPTPGIPGPFSWNGVQNFPVNYTGSLDSSGNISITLPDNNFIKPLGTKWRFTLCSNTSAPCQDVVTPVSGSSINLGSTFSNNIVAPRFGAGQFAHGYLDVEVTGTLPPGSTYFNVSTASLRVWTGTIWENITGSGGAPGLPNGTIQFNNAGVFTATPGSSVNASTGQVNVLNPSAGGSIPGTSWYMNMFENGSYAEDFNWIQSPGTPSSISVGANTVTINAVRGVNQFSASPGIYLGEFTKHWLYLAGTGTAEAVLITATNCTGASTGTCTVTFTAANTHGAGYTLGSATAGYQEAVNDAAVSARNYFATFGTFGWGGGTITGRPLDVVVFQAPLSLDWVQTRTGTLTLNGNGATIICNTPAQDCIRVSSGVGTNAQPEVTLLTNFTIVPSSTYGRTANGTSIAIHDASQHTMMWNIQFGLSGSANWFDTLISVDGDQNVDIGWSDFSGPGGGTPMKCDTTFCGAAIIGTTLNSAAFGTIHDNNLSTQCNGNAIDWRSGNGLIIRGNTFQNWAIYPWRYGAGLVDITDQGGNYYEAPCTNPYLGYVAQTGPQYFGNHVLTEGFTSPGIPPNFTQFSNTGTTLYTYYVLGINGSSQQTVPMMIGTSATNGSTNYTMKWPDFGASSYDVLRAGPLAQNGTDAAPYGTGNWQVGTGSCAAGVCSFTETFAAPTSITVNPGYVPSNGSLLWWPSPMLLSNNANTACDRYVGVAQPQVNTGLFTLGCYYQAVFTGAGTAGGNCVACNIANTVTGLRVLNISAEENQSTTGTATTGARLFPAAISNQVLTGYKGVINLASLISPSSHDSDLFTFYDSNYNKTLNTYAHQPANDANDCTAGFDVAPTYLSFRCGNPITFYVGQKFNSGTGRLFRVSTTGDELGTHMTQVATGNVAGTCVFAASTTCTVTYGTAFTSTPVVILTPVNPGAVTFTLTSSSNTAFTITGSGSNSLTVNWMAVGNPN